MLEFLKPQEKQRQKDFKQQQILWQEDFKRLHESIERQEERFSKLLECLTKQNDLGNLNIFSQESVKNSVGEFIYKPEAERSWDRDSSEGRRSIERPTSDVTPTARDL